MQRCAFFGPPLVGDARDEIPYDPDNFALPCGYTTFSAISHDSGPRPRL